jgi:hypothetical protein
MTINHEAIIQQQNLDQILVEEAEYGNEYGNFNDLDPLSDPEMFEIFTRERYSYGEEEIQPRKRRSIKAIKLG